ncbi:hypothetical protein [Deinococcus sp.]|uniref:hypothetical protein n=1 Tax=Deinococcus sp. TaxID=47478 RepID=UPI0025C6CF1A|nr:hypothetical protein [Deinococcus sp.]
MKINHKVIALMTALAVGAASAATTQTTAGTTISNTASASFTDPANPASTAPLTATSNTVNTTVLPKPSFDIAYTDGTADGNTLANTTVVTTGAVPGQSIYTGYSVVNTGNVALDVVLNADTTGSAVGATVQYYYYDSTKTNNLGAEITAGGTVTLAADNPATTGTDEGLVKIVQVITLPTDPTKITPTSVFGASPEGSVTGTAGTDPLVTPGNGYATGTTAYEDSKAVDTDLQFTRVTVYAPALDNNPNTPTTPTNPVDSAGNPITDPTKIPPVTSVDVPTLASGTTGDNTPVVPTPGYVTPGAPASDPTPGGTPIVPNVAGDVQTAYPKADNNNTTPDTVVFTNTLTNTGGATDKVQLFPALADGTPDPAYTFDTATGTFTNSTTGVTVRFLDPLTGAVIPVSTDPNNPTTAFYPTVTVPNGSTAVYRTEVTYPDTNDSDPIQPVTVKIGADSLKDADLVSNSTTTNTIMPPAAQFGDTTPAQGAVNIPAPVQTVNPGTTASPTATAGYNSPDQTDRTAVFPMDVVNNGQYNDSFTLSGSVTIGGVAVPVLYYDANGALLPRVSSDSNSPDYNKFITPVVALGAEIKVYAVIDVPTAAPAGDYTVSQTAVGNYSTINMTDTNDIIRVAPAGSIAVAKFVAKAGVAAGSNPVNGIDNPTGYTATGANGAKPGDTLSYKIIGKNGYNTPVANFALCDTVPANTLFSSVALSPAPSKTIYSVDGGSNWTATAPAAGLAAGTVICVAPDTDSNSLPDALPAGTTLTADFSVTIK